MRDLQRHDAWLAWLDEVSLDDPDVRCAWVGGSAATGGWDPWSDLDVVVLVTPDSHDAAYERLLRGARDRFELDHVWELPAGVWPGGRQAFLNTQSRPGLLVEPTVLVDLVVWDLTDERRFVDPRRHGHIDVRHDPEGLVVLRPDDEDAMGAARDEAVDQTRQRRATGEWLVNRAVARGHLAEATDLYLRFGLGPVVRLLRIEHCPWRHDYGLRYLDTDLPPDVTARVLDLLPSPQRLAELSAAVFAWQDELLDRDTG